MAFPWQKSWETKGKSGNEMIQYATICGKYGKTREETVNSSGITEHGLGSISEAFSFSVITGAVTGNIGWIGLEKAKII